MPHPDQFLEGFNIRRGQNVGPYVITDFGINEITVTRYHHYEYDVWVEFSTSNKNDMFSNVDFLSNLSDRDIFATRNYYHCSLRKVSEGNTISTPNGNKKVISYRGVCTH